MELLATINAINNNQGRDLLFYVLLGGFPWACGWLLMETRWWAICPLVQFTYMCDTALWKILSNSNIKCSYQKYKTLRALWKVHSNFPHRIFLHTIKLALHNWHYTIDTIIGFGIPFEDCFYFKEEKCDQMSKQLPGSFIPPPSIVYWTFK